jgi:hypothetical protein
MSPTFHAATAYFIRDSARWRRIPSQTLLAVRRRAAQRQVHLMIGS